MSTHYIEEAQRLADTVLIMSHGNAVAAGSPAELVAEHAGREAVEVYGPPAKLAEVEAAARAERPPDAAHRDERLGARRRGRGRARAGGRAAPGEPRGRLRPAHRRGDRLMASRLRTRGAAPRPAGAPGAHRRARARDRQLLLVLARRRRSPRRSSRRSTCSRSASASARSSARSAATTTSSSSATGTVATAVLFSSAFPAMFGTFVKYQFQRTYDAILAAPVDTEELVSAEALWMSTRAGVYGCVPLLVAIVFGLDPAWGMLAVPVHRVRSRASAGRASASRSPATRSRSRTSTTSSARCSRRCSSLAGTFFPLDELPQWAQVLGELQPAAPLRRARPPRRLRLRGLGRRAAPRRPRRLRRDHVADRDPRDDAQADRLARVQGGGLDCRGRRSARAARPARAPRPAARTT